VITAWKYAWIDAGSSRTMRNIATS
jgi:hypothetical protein